jgi:hypothetical protein
VRFVRLLALTLATFILALVGVDAVVRAAFPPLVRLQNNFSAAYLARVIQRGEPAGRTLFLGDSVLWGYRLPAADAAPTLLAQRGYRISNLSFEGGSIANTYVFLRLLYAENVKPQAVVFNVNIKEFNSADSAYRTLNPGLETLAWGDLAPDERALLLPTRKQTLDAGIDRALSKVWALYGMRSDLRELLFGHVDAVSALQDAIDDASGKNARTAAAHVPTADRFLGTYDLSPLTPDNVEVVFLRKTVALLQRWGVPAIAILTPTNHTLLHEYIDAPEYQAQLAYVTTILRPNVHVLDYDGAFPSGQFLDNDHLTAAGNRRLAQMLAPSLQP